MRHRIKAAVVRGFTLVEVLVALTILSVIAVMTWRGIEIMLQAQTSTQTYTDEVLALQAGLLQWQADLDAMVVWTPLADGPGSAERSLSWDGRVLRITRTAPGPMQAGVQIVAWALDSSSGAWRRWQSAPAVNQAQWRNAWQAAARWAEAGAPTADVDYIGNTRLQQDGAHRAVTIAQASDWQLHYFAGNAWANPLSSTGEEAASGNVRQSTLPDAVRLRITLTPGQAIAGALTLDWVRPDWGGGGPG